MYCPVLELASFGILPVHRRLTCLQALLEFLCFNNYIYLEDNPGTPPLYAANPKYVIKGGRTPGFSFGLDLWQDIPSVLARKTGDCKDFVCYRVAELRKQGMPSIAPYILPWEYISSTGEKIQIYHIVVRKGLELEDPSEILGMPSVDPSTFERLIK